MASPAAAVRSSRRRTHEESETVTQPERAVRTRRSSRFSRDCESPTPDTCNHGGSSPEHESTQQGNTPQRSNLSARMKSTLDIGFNVVERDESERAPSPRDTFFQPPPPRLVSTLLGLEGRGSSRRVRPESSQNRQPGIDAGDDATQAAPQVCHLSDLRRRPSAYDLSLISFASTKRLHATSPAPSGASSLRPESRAGSVPAFSIRSSGSMSDMRSIAVSGMKAERTLP